MALMLKRSEVRITKMKSPVPNSSRLPVRVELKRRGNLRGGRIE